MKRARASGRRPGRALQAVTSEAAAIPWWRRPETLRWLALPAAVALAAHAVALGAGFVWLDHAHIERGLAIEPLARLPHLFTRGFAGTGYYRPLMAVSLSLDTVVGAPWLYHATSLVWHAAAAVMVAVTAAAMGMEKRWASLAGALFGAHPATSLTANAIAFRSEAMLAVALLGLIAAHRARRPVLAASALLAGALAKETALVLAPLFVFALELEPDRARPRSQRLLVAEGLALTIALALRLAFAPPWRAEHAALAPGEAVGTRLASMARAAATLVLPLDRTVCDAFPVTPLASPRALAGLLLLAAVAWAAWRLRGTALLLLLSLLPAVQLVPVMRWWSPHYVYVPLAFAAMSVATAIARSRRPRGMQLAMAAVAVLAVATCIDGRRFSDDEALWGPEVEARPACREGHFYLGEVARSRQRWPDAEAHYRAALADWPGVIAYVDRAAALSNLGAVELEQRDLGEARRAFEAALQLTPESRERRRLTHNLAAAVLADGDADGAWRLLEPEVALSDALPESIYLAAKALHALGREEETRALIARLQKLGWRGERSPR